MAKKRIESVRVNGSEPTTDNVVGLLTSIFQEVRGRVTAPALEGKAQEAFEEFQRIKAGLTLRQLATVTLTASPTTINQGESATLSWTSDNADTVSIDNDVGNVEPVEAGSVEVTPAATTTFTATATGSCTAPTASVTVTVVSIVDVDLIRNTPR